ncbi:MAG: hypothetical protein HY741_05205 [Chloroflexi bacterium]|nr:hypothetical protein [Chloroflexota bacterium]
MYKFLILVGGLMLVALIGSACAGTTPTPAPQPFQPPTVQLERVEVNSYFPWPAPVPTAGAGTPTPAPPPAVRIPMVLDFVFTVNNPNNETVTLENMKYTVQFEGAPNVFFPVNTVLLKDPVLIPPRSAQKVRSTMVLDSLIVPGNLAVTSGAKLAENKLTGAALVAKWWQEIGDFKFKLKIAEGVAEFKSAGGNAIVPFEDSFPK